jgi:hypothetical protein
VNKEIKLSSCVIKNSLKRGGNAVSASREENDKVKTSCEQKRRLERKEKEERNDEEMDRCLEV